MQTVIVTGMAGIIGISTKTTIIILTMAFGIRIAAKKAAATTIRKNVREDVIYRSALK